MRRKPVVLAVAFAATIVIADLFVGTRIADGRLGTIRIPPYGIPDDTTIEALARRASEARRRKGPPKDPFLRFSTRYGWVNGPGEADVGGVPHHVNSLGARGEREVDEAAAPEGMVRVLCFGESFTYGSEVADGDDWPAQLEALDERLEVSNFGVGAWGTDQALLRFRELGPRMQPDVVVLGLLLENICRNVNRYRQLYQPDSALALVKPRFRLENGELELVPIPYRDEASFYEAAALGTLRATMSDGDWWAGDAPFVPFSNLAKVWAARRAHERRMPWAQWTRPDDEPFQVTVALLDAFHREALAQGIRVAPILIHQSAADHNVVDRRKGEPYWGALHDALDERGVPYLDTFGPIATMRAEGLEPYLNVHHSPAANLRIAELVLEHLRAELEELAD